MKRCIYCGIENEDDSNFCMACGHKFEETEKQQEPVKKVCKVCGNVLDENENFCPKCGARLETTNSSDGNREKFFTKLPPLRKKWATIMGAVIFVLLYLIIKSKLFKSTKVDTYDNNVIDFAITSDSTVFYNSKKLIGELKDTDINYLSFNTDKTKAACIENYEWDEGGTLYIIDENGKKEVDDGVISFVMSDSGDGVAYYKDYDGSTATLMLYNGSKSVEIDSDVPLDSNEGYLIISPDGKTVAYVKIYDENNIAGYISINGKEPKKLGNYQICIAIADDGKYVYYLKYDVDSYDGELYVKSGDKETKLASDIDDIGDIYFNKDYSQILYIYDYKTYVSAKGNEKKKIAADELRPLLPVNAQVKDIYRMKTIGVESFADTLLTSDYDVYYIDSNFEPNIVLDSFDTIAVTDNMEKIVYTDYLGDLYIATDLNKKKPKVVHLSKATNIDNYTVSEDGEKIYYVNDDDELYSITISNKPKKIADDVYSSYLVTYGKKLFFLVDYKETGTLYYTTGSNKDKVSNAEEVCNISRLGNGICYKTYSGGEYTIYGSTNGTKFIKIYEWDE